MISMARFHPSALQRVKQHPVPQEFASSTMSQDSRFDMHQNRSYTPNTAFQYDLHLGNDEFTSVKLNDARESAAVGSSTFSEPDRNTHPVLYPYQPTPLQIPTQTHSSDHSPSSYVTSAASEFSSHPFSYQSSSESRSLSPGERANWADHSDTPLPLNPLDNTRSGSSDLTYDNRLPHVPFPVTLHPLPVSLQALPPPIQARNDTSPRLPSPSSGSSECNSDFPHVKLGPNGLAEDQPPTAQGKMRTRVYVACLQCRSRKIRCDGAKPKCQKCARRSTDCNYDPAPKRRGPDKRPGARQRTSKKLKAAREEEARRRELLASVPTPEVMEREISDGSGPTTNHVKVDGDPSSGNLTWSPDAEDSDSFQESIATSSSAEGAAPVTPQDIPGMSVGLTPFPDLSDLSRESMYRENSDPHRLGRLGNMSQVQPTSQSRPTYAFNLSPVRMEDGHAQEVPSFIAAARQSAIRSRAPSSLNNAHFTSAHIETVGEQEEREGRWHQYHKRKWDACDIGVEPSLDFSRKTWWDTLLATYAPGSERSIAARLIHTDLQYLFKSSNYFFSFINVPLFFSTFCSSVERDRMQPSLVLASLAVSTFMKSSELDGGSAGRLRALWLRDAAQSALEASFNAQWIEPTLAQAAWLLAIFELCAHPYQSAERGHSSMVMLDSIIRSLALTTIDAHEHSVSGFSARAVPSVTVADSVRISRQEGCSCRSLTLGHISRDSHEHTPLWVATAAWSPAWSVAEIRKEESRRLCWSALQLAAGHTSHAAAFSLPIPDYYCIQPANYALFFPGESLQQAPMLPMFNASHSPKESIWALYSRAMLLWHSCLRMRVDDVSDSDKAAFAVNAWIESTEIESALDAHSCACDQAFLYQGREFLFITRMCISHEFRRFIPHPESEVNGLFNRKKAELWLIHQGSVAKRMMQGLHTVTGHKNNLLAQRPFFVWWFLGQVARCLTLWRCDHTLLIALDVCQTFFPPIDYLSCLWPCPAQRSRYLMLHGELVQACRAAGIPPPRTPNFDLLAPGSPPVAVV